MRGFIDMLLKFCNFHFHKNNYLIPPHVAWSTMKPFWAQCTFKALNYHQVSLDSISCPEVSRMLLCTRTLSSHILAANLGVFIFLLHRMPSTAILCGWGTVVYWIMPGSNKCKVSERGRQFSEKQSNFTHTWHLYTGNKGGSWPFTFRFWGV